MALQEQTAEMVRRPLAELSVNDTPPRGSGCVDVEEEQSWWGKWRNKMPTISLSQVKRFPQIINPFKSNNTESAPSEPGPSEIQHISAPSTPGTTVCHVTKRSKVRPI